MCFRRASWLLGPFRALIQAARVKLTSDAVESTRVQVETSLRAIVASDMFKVDTSAAQLKGWLPLSLLAILSSTHCIRSYIDLPTLYKRSSGRRYKRR